MNEKTLIGYHGTTKECCANILLHKFDASKALEGHWLGTGIYFYENLYYAIEWGIIKFTNGNNDYEYYKEQCAVIKCILNYEEYNLLDLNDPLGYELYQAILDNIQERFPDKMAKIKNGNDIEIIRLLEELEYKTGEKYISMFDIIIADYPKDIYGKKIKKQYGNFLPCIQKQICVKNEKVIESYREIDVDAENGKLYFDTIIKNREVYENEKQSRIIAKTIRKNKKYSR